MRVSFISLVFVATLALVFAGCGKPQEHQKMESDLNAEVSALQMDVKSTLATFTDVQAELDATLTTHNELVRKYAKKMKGHTADDITAAKERLEATKGEAETVLSALTAYQENMDHVQAMSKLNQDRESLIKVKEKVGSAASAAHEAIAQHEKMKNSLTAKAPAKASAKKGRA